MKGIGMDARSALRGVADGVDGIDLVVFARRREREVKIVRVSRKRIYL